MPSTITTPVMGRVANADVEVLRRVAAERNITLSTLVKHLLQDALPALKDQASV